MSLLRGGFRARSALLGLWAACTAACGNSDRLAPTVDTSLDQLMDPQTCAGCHPKQYEEWASSMHAYAADDPLFLAMNRRGQREAQVGSFCVNCHAPMAVRTQATTDGLNLDNVPQKLKGVTCYFCHSVDAVQGTHDSPLHLAEDGAMRAELSDALPNTVHNSSYSALLDRNSLASSQMCGSCHDIVNGHQVHLERTFEEWQSTAFSEAKVGSTCPQCHMTRSTTMEPAAAVGGAPLRYLNNHRFPAVDLPLTPWPSSDVLGEATQSFLDTALQSALCVRGSATNAQLKVVLDNVAAGHSFPSGAAQDRRAWLEVQAFSAGKVIYQSGVLEAGTPLAQVDTSELSWFGDCLLDAQAEQVHMFWEATDSESSLLPGQATFDSADSRFYQSHVLNQFPQQAASIDGYPDRVTLNVRLAPFGLDVFDDLVKTGDLTDQSGATVDEMRAALATRSVGQQLEWTPDTATETFTDRGLPISCVSADNLRANSDTVAPTGHSRCGP